jgi:CRISPR type III-A-associated protein Csm2
MGIEEPKIDPRKEVLTKLKDSGIENIGNWLKTGLDKEAITFCEQFGYCLSNYYEIDDKGKRKDKPLSTNQIRKVYGEVKRIEMLLGNNPKEEDWKTVESKVFLIKPKMAYSAKRDKTFSAECLYAVVKASITKIENESSMLKIQCFQNFAKLFEAVIAYHRAFEK